MFCFSENQIKFENQLKRKLIHREGWRSTAIKRNTDLLVERNVLTQAPHSEKPCLPAWDLMGASASSPGVARIPPGQRRGLQAVCGTPTHGPARGVHKRAAWGAETCAAKPVWNRAAAPAVARRRGRLLRRPSPGIIRSQVTFQPGAESQPPPSLLAMGFSGFSVSLKVTSQCGAELRKGGLRAAGVSEKQS